MSEAQSSSSKKNAKKKNKKKGDAADSELNELEQKIKQNNPNAELISDGWVEVKDAKKEKSKQRLIKKKEKEAKAVAATKAESDHSAATYDVEEKKEKPKKAAKSKDKEASASKKQKGPEQPSKKKKAKGADVKKPSNEADLIAVIQSTINAHPQRYLNVAAVGDRVQALTKCAWNKTFKPLFGTLKDFIIKHSSDFHFDPVLDRVYLKQEWDQLTAAKARQQAENNAKKAAKAKKPESSSSGAEPKSKPKKASAHGGGSSQSVDEASSPVFKIVAVLGLLGSLVFLTALAVNGFDVNAVISRAKSLLG